MERILADVLPDWVEPYLAERPGPYASEAERMALVVGLARRNVVHGTGGPFGAAVFEVESGALVAPGVNLVVAARAAVAHAEVVALTLASRRRGTHDLGGPGQPRHGSVTSVEPCAMCLGLVCWSGVRRLVIGARDRDARGIGFDEGPKPHAWVRDLAARGIEVVRDVGRQEARGVLLAYAQAGGLVYNGRAGA